ncbi:unnamed protein product [Lampetra fluviatilis]
MATHSRYVLLPSSGNAFPSGGGQLLVVSEDKAASDLNESQLKRTPAGVALLARPCAANVAGEDEEEGQSADICKPLCALRNNSQGGKDLHGEDTHGQDLQVEEEERRGAAIPSHPCVASSILEISKEIDCGRAGLTPQIRAGEPGPRG